MNTHQRIADESESFDLFSAVWKFWVATWGSIESHLWAERRTGHFGLCNMLWLLWWPILVYHKYGMCILFCSRVTRKSACYGSGRGPVFSGTGWWLMNSLVITIWTIPAVIFMTKRAPSPRAPGFATGFQIKLCSRKCPVVFQRSIQLNPCFSTINHL